MSDIESTAKPTTRLGSRGAVGQAVPSGNGGGAPGIPGPSGLEIELRPS